ncbi:MAG TPA: alpha-L-fucosidase [Chitinophaga sp.]|uniref:alpha-L-fucosidase n=1 Tax=Chitinophaga sp. TaxID=1869181 RepID=UPI002C2A92AD|nr:alpha-L-fucosidase [Chitinophaga sp.]HVI45149.1 alpha-L-fucosidase [Chitinophaga sp.]
MYIPIPGKKSLQTNRTLIRNNVKRMLCCVVAGSLFVSQLSAQHKKDPVTAPAPYLPVPGPAQLRWHKAEYEMFIHFGMKTFYPSDNHMGNGGEDPQRFNPSRFNASQWVKAARAGGFNGIVLTAKHHDGFCNWQTQTSRHSVGFSGWKNGKGDVVKELSDACRRNGMNFGLYVSIIDKHFERFGSKEDTSYGAYYYRQLKELSSNYGKIDHYWFDGFNADNLKLDYPAMARLIAKKQPEAVVYDSHTMVSTIPDRAIAWPGGHGGISPDQDYVQVIDGQRRWYPNEPSLILQGNWFHIGKPCVSLEQTKEYYLSTVGYGVTPLMNVAPNSDGLIDDNTIKMLSSFKKWVDSLHQRNPALHAKARDTGHRGNNPKFDAGNVNDGNYDTYFATDDNVTDATIELDLGASCKIDGFILQEYIPLGQRIDGYTIECHANGKWTEVFSGKKIGYQRIILAGMASAKNVSFPDADAVRLKIHNAHACPLINNFQVISLK